MTVAFSRTATFAHLFHKDNPTPLVLLGSWIVAHMTIEGNNTIIIVRVELMAVIRNGSKSAEKRTRSGVVEMA